ncbi:DUF6134 family protein [Paramagnetospirillum marisnigri]|uniref:DUF6134 family protein n=1 Tax=Paramagnetospirillum marisnigri TaxID=1285242 RepID=UPI0012E792BA|nr:DUF6134 family protein [Paramagnetospirillum marisnigri]
MAATTVRFPIEAANRRFSVLYDGDRIGSHTILSSSANRETVITTEIHLLVKTAFITTYAFAHRSEEVWRMGQLSSMRSDTEEDGESLHVEGRETPQGFRVVSKGRPFFAPAATLTSNSLWTPQVLEQDTVVDAQHGGVIGITSRKYADEELLISGHRVPVTRYTFITPYLAGSIWYDRKSLWVHGEFEHDGTSVRYLLDN